ncbi:bifunctional diguanylate cyclase/phosphodiesterase [Marinovum sp.]|uniref:putative bifunctional diguanylate cyclase/phosphodiesterase n=1 Tax=Marinovum sp. TaxID=2024839 RepID=UPI002B271BF5|nr:bifunctional diguanylate cyclase/phosphodiesterase [Marinovum sp.]
MPDTNPRLPRAAQRVLHDLTVSPMLPALFPALALGGFWIGGEPLLAALAIGVPLLWLAVLIGRAKVRPARTDPVTGLHLREGFPDRVDALLTECRSSGRTTVCFMVEVDDGPEFCERFGGDACDRVADTLAARLRTAMRGSDCFVRLSDWRIGVVLAPLRRIDVESAVQMAARLQSELEEPIRIDRAPVYVSACIGFCLAARAPDKSGTGLIDATVAALDEARRHGPGAIRAFSPDLQRNRNQRVALIDEAARALDDGQICAWYQPQICTETGRISGLEALARWRHPVRGLIPPGDFLPALEAAGLLERLGEVILFHALSTLRDLDRSGFAIPQVGVNFTETELRNPKLVTRLRWEIDRFSLAPERLAVEILEHVVAGTPDDIVSRNIADLAALGCTIDLDDFGTGHASITSLRRFAIDRLKFDRSFVVKCDIDPEQQRMVTMILTMAEKLGLETLAEGVETLGENALLSQLGCGHVQGFGIAMPMPADQLAEWITDHTARIARPPEIAPLPGPATRRSP